MRIRARWVAVIATGALAVVGIVLAFLSSRVTASRCENADGAVSMIQSGVAPGVVFTRSAAVRSGQVMRVRVAIIAAEFQYQGQARTGLWVTDTDLAHPSLVTALNDAAVGISTWPDQRTARVSAVDRISEATDGVAEALQCLR